MSRSLFYWESPQLSKIFCKLPCECQGEDKNSCCWLAGFALAGAVQCVISLCHCSDTLLRWHLAEVTCWWLACSLSSRRSRLSLAELTSLTSSARGWTSQRKDKWKYFFCCCFCVWANAQIGDLGAGLSAWALERDPSQSGYLGHAEKRLSCSAPGTRAGLISMSERIGKWV